MKRKIIIFVVAMLLLASVATALVACNESNDPNTLNLLVYRPETVEAKAAYDDMLDRFTEETGIKVKVNYISKDDYNTTLKTRFKTKNKPDVFYLDQPMLADYANLCLDLSTDFFANDGEDGLHVSDFFDVAIDTATYKGKILAVPFSLTSTILLYNKNLVKDVPTSWEEWKNMDVPSGKALFGGISSGGYASWYFQAFLKSAGGEMIDAYNNVVFNNEKGVAAAEMVKALYDKSPKGVRDSSNSFLNGNVMFQLAHNSDILNAFTNNPDFCKNSVGATLFIPQYKDGTSYSNIGGENIAISKETVNEDAAKKLVKFLLREENVNAAIANNFSAIKSFAKVRTTNSITGEQYPQELIDIMGIVLQQLNTASARPAVKNWTEVNDNYLASALGKILDEGESVKSALDTAKNQATSILDFD